MTIVKLTELNAETCSEINFYRNRLKTGVYHILDFMVTMDPETLRVTAYLNCVEGKFWTTSTAIIRELSHDIGKKIKETLKNPEVESIEVEIVPYRRLSSGKFFGLAFRMSEDANPASLQNKKDPEPQNTTPHIDKKESTQIIDTMATQNTEKIENTQKLDAMSFEQQITELPDSSLHEFYNKLLTEYKKATDLADQEKIARTMTKIIEELEKRRSKTHLQLYPSQHSYL